MDRLKVMCRKCFFLSLVVLIVTLSGCGLNDEQNMCKIVNSADITSESINSIITDGEWCYVRMDSADFGRLSEVVSLEDSDFEKAVGIYIYRKDEIYCLPVYAECVNEEVETDQSIVNSLYMVDNVKPVKLTENENAAYYIIYDYKDGNADVLGTAMLKNEMSKVDVKRSADAGTYDSFKGTFDFYPEEGVTLREYEVELTTSQNEEDFRIPYWSESDDEELLPAEYIQHEIWVETLDNGFYWWGRNVNSDYEEPVRISPSIVLVSRYGLSEVNEIDFTIRRLELKTSSLKKAIELKNVKLESRFLKHQFIY